MLFETLDKIRTKPKSVRDQYAFVAAVVFTVVLTGVWILSLPSRFSVITTEVATVNTKTAPFARLISQVKDQFGAAKESVATIITAASSTATNGFATSTSVSSELDGPGRPVAILIGSSSSSLGSSTNQQNIQIGTSSVSTTRQ